MRAAHPGRAGRAVGAASGQRPDPFATSRRRQLLMLQERLVALQGALAAVQEETRVLGQVEQSRPLGSAETKRVRDLRLESERLRCELVALRLEFEDVRAKRPRPSQRKA